MESIINFISGLFWFLFWVALILLIAAAFSFNKLRRLREEVREKRSNVRGSVKKMVDIINKASDVVKGYKGFEQMTQLKVSQDNSTSDLVSTVQQSSSMMASLQGAVQRFPDLKASGLYLDLMNDIRMCHSEIETKGQEFNQAVKNYNTVVLGLPAVLFARFVGFHREEYLDFDTGGLEEHVGIESRFGSEDDERVQQLLDSAGTKILGSTRNLVFQAGQAGKMLAAKIMDQGHIEYFYMNPGGVPKGPVSLDTLRSKLESGEIDVDILLAKAGTDDWKPMADMLQSEPGPRSIPDHKPPDPTVNGQE